MPLSSVLMHHSACTDDDIDANYTCDGIDTRPVSRFYCTCMLCVYECMHVVYTCILDLNMQFTQF